MKVAFIKQIYDMASGPWSTILWKNTTPEYLFNFWYGKAWAWEMTCLLKADWYLIPNAKFKGDYIKGALKDSKRVKIIKKYVKDVVLPTDIPYENYDIVITFDPILNIPDFPNILFAYYVQEDWDRIYQKSLQQPMGKYDLFLAHMMNSNPNIISLPQAVSFPYLSFLQPKGIFNSIKKENKAWIDWRTLTILGRTKFWTKETEYAAKRLKKILGISICYKDFNRTIFGISDPPLSGDAAQYFKKLGKCKYYIGVGRTGGGGQGLAEAASMGCICIGEANRIYHHLICHPELLCAGLFDLPNIFKKVFNSSILQKKAIEYQNKALQKNFVEDPINLLKKALKMKRKN